MVVHFKKLTLKKIQSGELDMAEAFTNTRDYFERLISKLLTRKGEILYREKHFPQALKDLDQPLNVTLETQWHGIGLV